MEEIWEQIKEQAVKVKDSAVQLTQKFIGKTNNVVDQTKIKFAMSDTQSKMEDIFTKIGSAVYKSHTDGVEAPEFTEIFAKLDDLKHEYEDLKEQLCRLQDTKQCPKCNTYNNNENDYCSKCGYRFDETVKAETAQATETVETVETFDDSAKEEVFTVEKNDNVEQTD